VSPPNAFDIGFALSVCAVGGLVTFAPLADEWARAASTGWMRKPVAALAVPVVAQCATLPVAIPAFNMISMVGPVANALVLPAASLGLCIGVASAVLMAVWPWAGLGLMRLAALVLQGVCWVVGRLAGLPRAAVAVGGSALHWGLVAFAIGALLWAFWPHPPRQRTARLVVAALCAYALFVAVGFQGSGGARLVVLDVGQGDAILVADGDSAVLIDTGPNESLMRTAAARAGIRHLDAVLLTHPHADHDGGLGGLADVVSVGRIGVPALTADEFTEIPGDAADMTGKLPVLLSQGDTMTVGGWKLTVLWPPNDDSEWETNDTSLVIEAAYGSFRAILTGDAESDPQIAMGRSGLLRDCNVLKVAHHGSAAGMSDVALRAWDPELALISVGEGNDFGHPTYETLSLLKRAGARVERTDRSGDLTISVGENEYELVRQ
ncbi:MAG: ComEC/Rec2 family competence protein, partial [Coriobacteriia bacterium]